MNASQIAETLGRSSRGSDGWFVCLAPCHEDHAPSFSVCDDPEKPGKIRTKCFAGCDGKTRAAALKARGLWPTATHRGTGKRSVYQAHKKSRRPLPAMVALVPGEVWQGPRIPSEIRATVCYHYPATGLIVARSPKPGGGKNVWQCHRKADGTIHDGKPPGVSQLPLFLTANSDPTTATGILICEGEKAAMAAAERLPGWSVLTWPGGSNSVEKACWKSLSDKTPGATVHLWPDNDAPGLECMATLGTILNGLGHGVRMVAPIGLPESKNDCADFAGSGSEFLSLIETAQPFAPDDTNTRPALYDSGDFHETEQECLRLIGAMPELFQRDGSLVTVREFATDPAGLRNGHKIDFVTVPDLKSRLAESAIWLRQTADGAKPIHPRKDYCESLLARKQWPATVRPLQGLATLPILRKDGSTHSAAGYDSATGYYLIGGTDWLEPITDPQECLEVLSDLICDFPFNNPCDKSAALLPMLTGAAMHAFEGPTPFHLVEAPRQGAGKTLLCKTAGAVILGREPFPRPFTNPEEMEKSLLGLAVGGAGLVWFDNISGRLGGQSFELALTAGRIAGRVLGLSKDTELALRPVWIGSGNNCEIANLDTARRTVRIRLAAVDRGDDFRPRHSLPTYALETRPRIVAALLGLLRNRLTRRDDSVRPVLASFEPWSDLVCGSLVQAGWPDPLASMAETLNSNSGTLEHRRLIHLVESAGSRMTSAQILQKAKSRGTDLSELATGRDIEPSPGALGRRLAKYLDAPLDDRVIRSTLDRNGLKLWWVEARGLRGSQGSFPPITREKSEKPPLSRNSGPPVETAPASPANPAPGNSDWLPQETNSYLAEPWEDLG